MPYHEMSDTDFVDLLFTSEDRINTAYVEEAERRLDTLVPLLCAVLKNEDNYDREDDPHSWGIVHTVRILGILGDVRATEALLTASAHSDTYEIEEIWDLLGECFLRMGPAAIPAIRENILARIKEEEGGGLACEMEGLWNFWEAYPRHREEIEDFLLHLLDLPETSYEIKANIAADFAQIHRTDLKPLFEELFEAGEVDLETLTREDMDSFYRDERHIPGRRVDLRALYDPGEIEKSRAARQEWEAEWKAWDFEFSLIENLNRIGRNDPCPCGSGRKFKKCHLDWATERARVRKEEEDRMEPQRLVREALTVERRSESELRRFLTRKGQTPLFSRIKEKIQEALTDPQDKFMKKRFFGYFQPFFNEIDFSDESELRWFTNTFMDYYNALASYYLHYPRESNHLHS